MCNWNDPLTVNLLLWPLKLIKLTSLFKRKLENDRSLNVYKDFSEEVDGTAAAAVNVPVKDRQNLMVKRPWLNLLIPPDVGQTHSPEKSLVKVFKQKDKRKGLTAEVAEYKQTNKSNRVTLIQHNPISIQSAPRVKTASKYSAAISSCHTWILWELVHQIKAMWKGLRSLPHLWHGCETALLPAWRMTDTEAKSNMKAV